jgi:tRNA(Ile)-lysidine synthase
MHELEQAITNFSPKLPLAIALSGGADSSALLLACARRWPGQVHALHIHHGLQAAADVFEQHCVNLCIKLGTSLKVSRVDARNAKGQSPEAAARHARYAALAQLARQQGITDIALAHQADDQVETLLIALSRGAGVAGLAAMPTMMQDQELRYHRPLLAISGVSLRAWLRSQNVDWIEDPSNDSLIYTRNRIRAQLLPVIEDMFPHFRATFARSATHAAQAQQLLEELAQQDLKTVGVPPSIRRLQALSYARLANTLRYWLAHTHDCIPSAAQLEELISQIGNCTTRGHRLSIKTGNGWIKRKNEWILWSQGH